MYWSLAPLRICGGIREKKKRVAGLGGQWEGFVITQVLYDAAAHNTKFIPIVFSPDDKQHIPVDLGGATYYDLSKPDGYDNVFRRVTMQPARKPSPVAGTVRTMPTAAPLPAVPSLERKSPSTRVRRNPAKAALHRASAGESVFHRDVRRRWMR